MSPGEGTPGDAQPASGTPSQAYDERPAVARGSYFPAQEGTPAETATGGAGIAGGKGGKGGRRPAPNGRALEYAVTASPGDPAGARRLPGTWSSHAWKHAACGAAAV